MHPDLEKLVHLQLAENQIRQVEASLQEIPGQRAELTAALQREAERLSAAREKLAAAQKRRRQDESSLQDRETQRSKYKGQLMDVKTNKEYSAMLHEIESVEREIRSVEDRILEAMEAAESLAAEVSQEEKAHKEAENRSQREIEALDRRSRELEEQRARFVTDRDAIASTIPEELLTLFRRVARLRGAAVAEARDGMCQHCHVVLRPQMYVDIKHNDEIVQCPSCSRILHYVPATVFAAEP